MEQYIKTQYRLIECYRGSNSKEEAEENCKKYQEKMIALVNGGAFEIKNVMQEMWKRYHKTERYYKPNY